MKNSKNILIGSVIIALLLVAASYKFFYLDDVEKADQVQAEIDSKQVRLNELTEKNSNRMRYESGIVDSKDIINTILSIYGPGNTPEKTIMLVVDMCEQIGIDVPTIAFVDNTRVFESDSTDENGEPKIQIFKSGMAIKVNGGYTQIKKLMDYINSYPERMNVENFTEAFEANTGKLALTMNVNFYGVTDENHIYEAPVIENIDLGSTNVFRTAESVTEEEENTEGTEAIDDSTPVETTTDETTQTE